MLETLDEYRELERVYKQWEYGNRKEAARLIKALSKGDLVRLVTMGETWEKPAQMRSFQYFVERVLDGHIHNEDD